MIKLIIRLAYILSMFIQGLILTRIVLIVIGANMENSFASWVMHFSDIFVSPFNGIVDNIVEINGIQIPLVLPSALLIYIVASFVLSELLKTFAKE